MRSTPDNPSGNTLPPGIEEAALVDAIDRSGYPLQGVVASLLDERFSVTEEWGYFDRETGDHRSLDVFAYRWLISKEEANKSDVVPAMTLLVECKRSALPNVFFRAIRRPTKGVPAISGVPNGLVRVQQKLSGNQSRVARMKPVEGLRLNELPFVEPGPPICAAFAGAQRKGDGFQLSGNVPFNKMIMPLVNAIDHRMAYDRTEANASTLYPSLLVAIAVVDIPMVLVEAPSATRDPVLTPWVRVVRQEAPKPDRRWDGFQYYGIDIVHIDYLEAWLATQLDPFAEKFAARAMSYSKLLRAPVTVADVDSWTLDEVGA